MLLSFETECLFGLTFSFGGGSIWTWWLTRWKGQQASQVKTNSIFKHVAGLALAAFGTMIKWQPFLWGWTLCPALPPKAKPLVRWGSWLTETLPELPGLDPWLAKLKPSGVQWAVGVQPQRQPGKTRSRYGPSCQWLELKAVLKTGQSSPWRSSIRFYWLLDGCQWLVWYASWTPIGWRI